MEDLLDTRGIGLGLRVVWWGGEMKHTVCGTQFGKQSEIVFDFADVFVGIGPRFTAVEPSRVVPQCLQGLSIRKISCLQCQQRWQGKRHIQIWLNSHPTHATASWAV